MCYEVTHENRALKHAESKNQTKRARFVQGRRKSHFRATEFSTAPIHGACKGWNDEMIVGGIIGWYWVEWWDDNGLTIGGITRWWSVEWWGDNRWNDGMNTGMIWGGMMWQKWIYWSWDLMDSHDIYWLLEKILVLDGSAPKNDGILYGLMGCQLEYDDSDLDKLFFL